MHVKLRKRKEEGSGEKRYKITTKDLTQRARRALEHHLQGRNDTETSPEASAPQMNEYLGTGANDAGGLSTRAEAESRIENVIGSWFCWWR